MYNIGKGDRRRPRLITREEEDLRWKLYIQGNDLPLEEIVKIKQRIFVLVDERSHNHG